MKTPMQLRFDITNFSVMKNLTFYSLTFIEHHVFYVSAVKSRYNEILDITKYLLEFGIHRMPCNFHLHITNQVYPRFQCNKVLLLLQRKAEAIIWNLCECNRLKWLFCMSIFQTWFLHTALANAVQLVSCHVEAGILATRAGQDGKHACKKPCWFRASYCTSAVVPYSRHLSHASAAYFLFSYCWVSSEKHVLP